MSEDLTSQDLASSVAGNEVPPAKGSGSLYDREFWAISRHELIGGAAEDLLSSQAREQVRRILEPLTADSLSDIAGWADTVKRRRPRPNDDEDTRAFLEDSRNAKNDTWHYVNVPLGTEEYSRERYPAFTGDEDVVQMIREAVLVLKKKSNRFSELNALRLVVHLVGDVHQPVHVGCCYLEKTGGTVTLVTDPDEAATKHLPHDQGGNKLILPVGTGGISL